MPRIDPQQLLECLAILLAPNGGIKSTSEVERISGLMKKFCKKLVSKCIYIQILKCSETELLQKFMEIGGWQMIHTWLEDARTTNNWPLVQEILELFLLCPVDVNRLKSNSYSAPKLVKNLSKETKHEGVKILSSRLVEQWLKLVKGLAVSFPVSQMVPDSTRLEQMPLDPNHPSYADSLAIEGDELNGLGGSADIDVDDIIPTLSHHHPAGPSDENLFHSDATTVDGGQAQQLATTMGESSSAFGNNKNPSSSCIVNNHEAEKDNLKIKIIRRDGEAKVTRSSGGSSSKEGDEKKSSSSSKRSSSGSGDKEKSKERRSSSSSKSSSSHHKSSSSSSSSSKRSSSSSGKSSSSSRDKDRSSSSHRSSHSSSKSSSSSSSNKRERDEKEAAVQADKDKDTLTKVMGSGTLEKLGKIPKKVKSSIEEGQTTDKTAAPAVVKKFSISIEVRKDPENRPKTVKTFNSQFRDHGLVEDIPPPPSRKTLKKPAGAATTPTTPTLNKSPSLTEGSLKRASPPKEASPISPVSEKRLKLDQIVAATASPTEDKAGGIKLIAARSKPTLIESDMFMDALCSSAANTAKGVAKKRKRVPSTSKDGSPPLDSPKIVAAPMKFYQDTLEEIKTEEGSPTKKVIETKVEDGQEETSPSSPAKGDEDQTEANNGEDNNDDGDDSNDEPASPGAKSDDEAMDVEEDTTPKPPGPGCGPNGPPGVLCIHRRRGTKKTVRWRPQESLEDIRMFELDETERVNVTKTFTDMKQMERCGERDMFQMARKLQSDDVMVEQTPWTAMIEVDDVPVTADGSLSKEREIQMKREQTCLQALYFNFAMIPDSPSEPETETYKYADPASIPLEDTQNTVNDFTKQGWPEPKEMHGGAGGGHSGFGGGPPGFDPSQFGGVGGPFNMPSFGGGGPGGIWGNGPPPPFGGPGGVGPNGMPFGGPGGALNNDEIKLAMNRLAFPGQTFNPPNFNGINMMNLPAMAGGGPMAGPGGINGPPGGWGFRGPPPMGGGGVWRGHGPPGGPPNGPRRDWINNGGNSNSRLCKNFKKGFCKKGDNCNFLHAGGPGGFKGSRGM